MADWADFGSGGGSGGEKKEDQWADFGGFETGSTGNRTTTPSQSPPQPAPAQGGGPGQWNVAPPPPGGSSRRSVTKTNSIGGGGGGGTADKNQMLANTNAQIKQYKQRMQVLHQQLVAGQAKMKELQGQPNQAALLAQYQQKLQGGIQQYRQLEAAVKQLSQQASQYQTTQNTGGESSPSTSRSESQNQIAGGGGSPGGGSGSQDGVFSTFDEQPSQPPQQPPSATPLQPVQTTPTQAPPPVQQPAPSQVSKPVPPPQPQPQPQPAQPQQQPQQPVVDDDPFASFMEDKPKDPPQDIPADPFNKPVDSSFTSATALEPTLSETPQKSAENERKIMEAEGKLTLAEQEKMRLQNDNQALLKSKDSLEQQLEEWKVVLEDSEARYEDLQAKHKNELEDVRKAGHDTLAIIVEEYKEQSCLAVQQERERCQQMLAEALAKEVEKMGKVLEEKSAQMVSTMEEEQQKNIKRTEEAIEQLQEKEMAKFEDRMATSTTTKSDILSVLDSCGLQVAHIPKVIRHALKDAETKLYEECTITVVNYVADFLLPNLSSFEVDLQSRQVLFLLKHFHVIVSLCSRPPGSPGALSQPTWLEDALLANDCIPCEPCGHLSAVKDLISPKNNLFSKLFCVEEKRFPLNIFLQEVSALQTLEALGMCCNTLREEDIIGRAKHAIGMAAGDMREYCMNFIKYLLSKHCDKDSDLLTSTLEELSKIRFVPLFTRPRDLSVPWCHPLPDLAAPRDIYQPAEMHKVFTYGWVPDRDVVGTMFFSTHLFGPYVKPAPTDAKVKAHLLAIAQWGAKVQITERFSVDDSTFLKKCLESIYKDVDKKMKPPGEATRKLFSSLQEEPIVWVDGKFQKPIQCVICCSFNCYPYLTVIESKLHCKEFLKCVGVQDKLTRSDALGLLHRVEADNRNSVLPDQLLSFVRDLAIHITELPTGNQESPPDCHLPDDDAVMREVGALVCKLWDDDATPMTDKLVAICPPGTLYLHRTISKYVAKGLGVRDVLSHIMELLSEDYDADDADDDIFEQRELLTVRLNNVLKQYKADVTIFKEFIQNADDAKATEIAFIVDERCDFAEKYLISSNLLQSIANAARWEGLQKMPSLLVYNNHKFEEEDIKGIVQLGTGSEGDQTSTIGRFDLWFNLSYHVTDCPMFLSYGSDGSGENFCVFDPTKAFLPKPRGKPCAGGKRIDFRKQAKLYDAFPDQFKPFLNDEIEALKEAIQGGFCEHNNGHVVYRLPLTRCSGVDTHRTKMKLTEGCKMTVFRLKLLLKELQSEAPKMLLFLSHVKRISVLTIAKDGNISSQWTVNATVQTDSGKVERFSTACHGALEGIRQSTDTYQSQAVVQEVFDITMEEQDFTTNSPAKVVDWIVSKRFGAGDITSPPSLVKSSYDQYRVCPIVGVATSVTKALSSGQLFSSLPLPVETKCRFHIHGQFCIDSGRSHLKENDWNRSLVKDCVPRAMVALLHHAKFIVNQRSLSDEIVKWFYDLFIDLDYQPHSEILEDLPKQMYELLTEEHACVLLSYETSTRWYALTLDESHENRGWFPRFGALHEAFVSIGVKLTKAPMRLNHSAQHFTKQYDGCVTPKLIRKYLKTAESTDSDFQDVVVPVLGELFDFVVSDLDIYTISEVHGLPLLLTSNNALVCVKPNSPLFSPEYRDLFDESDTVISDRFINRSLWDKHPSLRRFGVAVVVTPDFVAANIKSCVTRDQEVELVRNSDTMHCQKQVWKYIRNRKNLKIHHVRDVFSHLAILPTSRGTLVPLANSHTILNACGQYSSILQSFDVPWVDFSILFSPDECDCQSTCFQIVQPILGNIENSDNVLFCFASAASFRQSGALACHHSLTNSDVVQFILYVQGSESVVKHREEFRRLSIFKSTSNEWTSIASDCTKTVYAVQNLQRLLRGMDALKDRVSVVLLYENCEAFFTSLGFDVLKSDNDCYTKLLVPHFELLSPVDQIHHLKMINALDGNGGIKLFHTLKTKSFVSCSNNSGNLKQPSQLFDPTVELFQFYLEKDDFPDEMWTKILPILRSLGLVVQPSTDLLLKFAAKEAKLPLKKERFTFLLAALNEMFLSLNPRGSELQTLLEQLHSIPFLSRFFSEDFKAALTNTKANYSLLDLCKRVPFCNSVVCTVDESQLVCLLHPVVIRSHSGIPARFKGGVHVNILEMLKVVQITPQLVAQHLLKLTEAVSACILTSAETCTRDALKSFQDVFKAHYKYLSAYPLHVDCSELRKLQESHCVFVDSDSNGSFKLLQGCNLVERMNDEDRAYNQYILVVPDYLNDFDLRNFREAIGIVKRSLTAEHFVSLFHTLRKKLQNRSCQLYTEDPNIEAAVNHAYQDFLALLKKAATDDISFVKTLLQKNEVILLPSQSGLLLPSTDLVFCDNMWFRDNIPVSEENRPHFIATPKSPLSADGIPACLGICRLTTMVSEHLNTDLLRDEYNRCDLERYAKQNSDPSLGCASAITLREFLQSPDFATGLLRIMNHKEEVTKTQSDIVTNVQNLQIFCVQSINTSFSYRGQKFPGTEELALLNDVENPSELFVCFDYHSADDNSDSDTVVTAASKISNPPILDGIVQCLHKYVGPYIHDSHHLKIVFGSLSDPSTIEAALDRADISSYSCDSIPNSNILGECGAVIIEDFELLILSNFKQNEYVKFCDGDGNVKALKVASSVEGPSVANAAMPTLLNLTHRADLISNISCLLVCKYLTAGQKTFLQSQLKKAPLTSGSSSNSDEKVVLLKLPLDSPKILCDYVRSALGPLSSADSDGVQLYFAIERLLFHIHYCCSSEGKSPQEMIRYVDEYLHCIEFKILNLRQDSSREFNRKLHKKADTLLARNQPVCGATSVSGQPFPYLSQSSWLGSGSGSSYSGRLPPVCSVAVPQGNPSVYPRLLPHPWPVSRMAEQDQVDRQEQPCTSMDDALMWIQQSYHDLYVAQRLAAAEQETGYACADAACFHAHEAVEKALTAVFLGCCDLIRHLASCHSIVDLHQTMTEHPTCPAALVNNHTLQSQVVLVSRHSRCCRFPDANFPPAPPMLTHSASTAHEVVGKAALVFRAIVELDEFARAIPEGDVGRIQIPPSTSEYPSYWKDVGQGANLLRVHVVRRGTPEYRRIHDCFHSSVPTRTVHICCIERIQNTVIWEGYQARVNKMRQDPDLQSFVEKMLFYGSRQTEPDKIHNSETGFDLRFSRDGLWGRGNYFACNAQCSLSYAYHKGNRQYQMFVARVAPGVYKDCGTTQVRYDVPPERPIREGQVTRRYNSVRAETGGSEIYITYENYMAYPEYLITYTSA